ncbi:uncharacterized protein N7483_000674 [Penicillium malachiteum]|uniref:uncharacterized protein n=1 Tax=Penicillium malachiteum TaxID=1324776 RepID=UPI0025485BD1|nr:uncharacterized protein N7483_000674 [Penicillium malachiteum]KAJ5735549.1 hypothetical protein N7483_000674 [Penicillium malachiteum]
MQYTTLATLFFATAVLAAPKPQDSDSSISYATSSDDTDSDGYDYGLDVPTSIESVLATAIPSTWLMEYETNDAFFTSVVDAMEKGNYPDWVNALPSGAHAYVTSELQDELSEFTSEMAAATGYSGYESSNTGTVITPTATDSATVVSGTASGTGSTSTATGSSKSSSSGASSSASSGAASSTSSGGAPAATGTIAMGLAGAAGILGIALAL